MIETLIENTRASIWAMLRDIRTLNLPLFDVGKPLLCRLGLHKMRRGFGWSMDKRMDICLRNHCRYSKWHKDKRGSKLIQKSLKK